MRTADPPEIAAIRHYLEAVETGPELTPPQLAKAIDTLVMSVHAAPPGDPAESDATAPARDYKDDYRRLGERLSALGYYAVADPLAVEPSVPTIGDAIDDLVDISRDLRQVLWRYEAHGRDDALWHFHFLFLVHWGQHARELSLYLHALARAEA